MFAKIKGYIRRLRTPKKETQYESKQTTFGEINASFIDAVTICNMDEDSSNIIIGVSYPNNMEDSLSCYKEFINMISPLGIRFINIDIKEKGFLYLSGSVEDYDILIGSFNQDPEKSDNKIFRKLCVLLRKIDIVSEETSVLTTDRVTSYNSTAVKLTKTDPVFVQSIDTYWIDKDVLDANINIFDKLKSMINVYIYDPISDYIYAYSVLDFIYCYSTGRFDEDLKEYINTLRYKYESNFAIPGYKNIFDINFLVTDLDSSSKYDIDEPLD